MKPTNSPRPTQPRNNQVKSGTWTSLLPQQKLFRGLGLAVNRKKKTHYNKLNPIKFSENTLLVLFDSV